MQDTAGNGRDTESNFPENPQSKKNTPFPYISSWWHSGKPQQVRNAEPGHKNLNTSVDCQVARLAGVGLKWPHAIAVKCLQKPHIYHQLGSASNPGWGNGKISNGPNALC